MPVKNSIENYKQIYNYLLYLRKTNKNLVLEVDLAHQQRLHEIWNTLSQQDKKNIEKEFAL